MTEYLWPLHRFDEAIRQLTISTRQPPNPQPPIPDPIEIPYPDLEPQLHKIAPAIIQLPSGYAAVLSAGRASLRLATPTGIKKVPISTLRAELCRDLESPLQDQITNLLTHAEIPAGKQDRARAAILREQLRTKLIRGIWILRLPPSADFWQQLRQAKIPSRLLALAGAHTLQYTLWILAWWLIGENVLRGQTNRGWLVWWALLLLALVPLRVLITWLQGQIAIRAGTRLKQRLFFGALRLDPDSLRHQGAGQLLGGVIETEAVEALALSGGFLALVALMEIAISLFVLAKGAGGLLQSALLIAWLAMAALLALRYYRRNREWTDVRLAMTHDLVESMVGHRTRLAQLPPDRWHTGEDDALKGYLKSSRALDNSATAVLAIVPRGWLILGLAGLIPAFARGIDAPARIAIAVGGMLLAYRALRRLVSGASQLAGAAVAWQRAGVLYRAAMRGDVQGTPDPHMTPAADNLLEIRDLSFRYNHRTDPVLRGCNLEISTGNRLVLEGASGGGKSTLVSLLVGLREPSSGRLLINGFDRQTLGAEAWRRYVAAAPQFHENHVLAETFAFNLFLGRPGPIGPKELQEAELICAELGLSDLIERMSAGLLQMVGETGWQLSHGERSRLYIARALLQNPELVVLDESFAALDPQNLELAIQCVLKRAKSLLVISHR